MTGGPQGTTRDAAATFAFRARPAAGRYECRVDAAPFAPCTSPHTVGPLPDGEHVFAVRYAPDGEHPGPATERRWTIDATAPAVTFTSTPSAEPDTTLTWTSEPGATFVCSLDGTPAIDCSPPHRLVGLTPGPHAFSVVAIDAAGNTSQAAVARWDVAAIPLGASFALGPLPAAPQLQVEFNTQDGGGATVTVALELPDVFRGVPGNTGVAGLALEAGFKTSNDRGGAWSVKGGIEEAWLFGRLHLKDLSIAYDDSTGVFNGSVGIALASDATLTAAVELGPNGLIGPLRKLSLQASGLDKHIGHGIFLQRLGASIAREGNTVSFGGNGGISFGPRLDFGSIFEGEAISLDGEITLAIPTGGSGPPFTLAMRGVGKVLEFELAEAQVTYTPPLRVELTGRLVYSVAGAGIEARITDAWAEPGDFNLEAQGRANLFGFLDGRVDVVVSTTGMAACLAEGGGAIGFGKRWNRPLQVFADTCDVGPFRRTAQAAATHFSVEPGTRVKVVDGPAGLTLDGPGAARTFRVDHDGRTTIALLRPRPGLRGDVQLGAVGGVARALLVGVLDALDQRVVRVRHGAPVEGADRHDPRARAAHERAVGAVQLHRPDVALLGVDAKLGGDLQHGAARDPGQRGARGGRDQRLTHDDEQVRAGAFGDRAERVEHHGVVHAEVDRLLLGQDRVQVVAGLHVRADRARRLADDRAREQLDRLRAQEGRERVRAHDQRRHGAQARVDARAAEAARDQRAAVRVTQVAAAHDLAEDVEDLVGVDR
jgi:hypothetical protein